MNELMRQCLEEMDVGRARVLWAHVAPHLPQPSSDDEARLVMHIARTAAESLHLETRAYSHAWLRDHGYPQVSRLPDHLLPKAERMYPRVADAVGISVNTGSELFRPVIPHVQRAMSDAVMECYADGHREAEVVKPRMMEARRRVVGELLGIR